MIDKASVDNNETQPPSLNAVRDIFNEFNVFDVSDEICIRVLDIIYKHTCDVVEEAKAISHHVGHTKINTDDMNLAINMVGESLVFAPPYTEQLLAYAEKNEQPLPAIRPHCGIRLPAERYNTTAPNYSFISDTDNEKSNATSEHLGSATSVSLQVSNSNTKGILKPMLSSNLSISMGSSLNSSVHVIASQGVGPSMIRVQNLPQISSMDGSAIRTLPTVSSVISLNRRFTDS